MISVIIPAFNSEKTIARAIDSVLAQTYKDYEIIVVDDGSTDNTAEIVRGYDNRINYIYQQNAGHAAARNSAIKVANGRWVAFLDADDQWLPQKLQLQIELLDKNKNLKWCCCNRYQSDGNRKNTFGNEKKITEALQDKDYFENYFSAAPKGNCPIVTTCLIISKNIFEQLGTFDSSYTRGEDLDMWWRIAHHFPQIGYIAQPLAIRYLDIENPVSRKQRLDMMRGHNRRKLVSRHLALAKKTGNIEAFEPFASKVVKEGLTKMLYCGYGAEARQTVVEFNELLGVGWRLGVYVLTVFPAITSVIAKTLLWLIRKSRCSRSVNR